jgi:P4 family phage/plasmid primase-like protien
MSISKKEIGNNEVGICDIFWKGKVISKDLISEELEKIIHKWKLKREMSNYELIRGGNSYRIFFDVDFYVLDEMMMNKYKNEVNERVKTWIREVFDDKVEIRILSSNGYSELKKCWKISWNYIILGYKFNQGEWFKKWIIDNGGLNIDYPIELVNYNKSIDKSYGIDLSIYKNTNQLIRLIYSSKKEERRPKIPIIEGNIRDYIISLPDEKDKEIIKLELNEDKIEIENVKDFIVEKLLNIISEDEKYYNDYNLWLNIGWILQSLITKENKEYYEELYNKFSKQSKSYKSKLDCVENMRKYVQYNYKKLHINSLIYYALQVNSKRTIELLKNQKKIDYINNDEIILSKELTKSLTGIDNDIADYLIQFIKDEYVCVDVKNQIFYYFNGVRWKKDNGTTRLYEWIKMEGSNKYLEEEKKIINILKYIEDDKRRKEIEKIKELVNMIYKKVRRHSNINLLIQCIGHGLYNEKFLDNLDVNRYLLGFENGIYDLKNRIFREGKPDDYITLSTGMNYPTRSDKEKRKEIEEFFSKVHMNEEIKRYNYEQISWSLCGNQEPQICISKTGTGANGKSVEAELIQKTLGEYCYKLEGGYLTINKVETNKGDPFMDKLRGVRYVYSVEPQDANKINSARLKEMTGGDLMQYRLLFSNEIKTFYPQIHLFVYCNKKLDFDGTDTGLQRRIKVVEYQTKFTDIPKKENEFLKDDKIRDKLDSWKEEFMLMLLEIYDYDRKYKEPELISLWSNKYCNEKNDIVKFINENLEKGDFDKEEKGKKTFYITLNELKEIYKNNGSYDRKKLKELKDYIEKETNEIFEEIKKINGITYRNVLLNYRKISNEIEDT